MENFLISDTHFSHFGVCKFLCADGVTKIRPWDNPDEMDEALVANWNSVVAPADRVYHLGDVVINRKALSILNRLNGRKILIKGNHDIFDLKDYVPYFDDIRACHKLDNYFLAHIPIHPLSLARWANGQIHGHLHQNRVPHPKYPTKIDPRYFNVSVEQINYTPISFDDVKKAFEQQKKDNPL